MNDRGKAPGGIPPEPNASDEPHDVLAAEEFAIPAPPAHGAVASAPQAAERSSRRRIGAVAAAVGVALAALWRRRRRG
jgi:hypothetical protein